MDTIKIHDLMVFIWTVLACICLAIGEINSMILSGILVISFQLSKLSCLIRDKK